MDSTDIRILRALGENCRTSYQEMGRELGMTANAVKKRVKKLVAEGTIHDFLLYLSPAMAEVEIYLAIVNTEGLKSQERVLNDIVEYPNIYSTGRLSDGTCIVFGEYYSSESQAKFETLLLGIDGIIGVEVHQLQVPQGKKVDLKPLQLRVLRCLFEDPRMPVADIASKTSLTPRRVRRIISQLIEGGGVRFVARINPNAGSGVIYYAILIWDESKTTLTEVEYWVEKEFSGQYYDSYISASAPMMLCLFVVSHLRDAELLSERISHESMIQSIKTIIPFPTKKNVRLQRLKLEQLLQL
ncbi:MAG: winged helix-turn-helix transcriptional regulator [Candidatus Thorarchaeota archaeon]